MQRSHLRRSYTQFSSQKRGNCLHEQESSVECARTRRAAWYTTENNAPRTAGVGSAVFPQPEQGKNRSPNT